MSFYTGKSGRLDYIAALCSTTDPRQEVTVQPSYRFDSVQRKLVLIRSMCDSIFNREQTCFHHGSSMTQPPLRPHFSRTGPAESRLTGVALEDWDALFSAVKARLSLIAQPNGTPSQEQQLPQADAAADAALRTAVLECVAALDFLHTSARDESSKR